MTARRDLNKGSIPDEARPSETLLEPNQISGGTESSDASSGPLVAAYAAGRLLNRLEWHLQQAWLLPAIDMGQASDQERAVSSILGNLAPTLEPALSTEAELKLRERLLAERDEWYRTFLSPGHLSRIEDVANLIRYEIAQQPDILLHSFLEQYWRHEIDWVEAFASKAIQLILADLEERGQRALELGRWVDRGVHPRAAYRFMCRPTKTSVEEPLLGPLDPFSGAYGGIITENIPEDITPALFPITAGMIRPDPGWMDQLRHSWREMGLAVSHLESFVERQRVASASGILTGIESHIASLDKWVREELAEVTPEEKIPPGERTRPMALIEAAKLMGYRGKKAAEQLKAAIDYRSVKCERRSRQQYVFSKLDFPDSVWGKLN